MSGFENTAIFHQPTWGPEKWQAPAAKQHFDRKIDDPTQRPNNRTRMMKGELES